MNLFKLFLTLVIMIQLLPSAGFASSEIKVRVNERTIAMDSNPYISKNLTMIPIRFVADALGCDAIEWNESNGEVEIKYNNHEILFSIDSTTAYIDKKKAELPVAATIKNNRTHIPLRFVSENMGASVSWNEEERIVDIYKDDFSPDIPYAEDELYWLARIIHAEAQGEPFSGKVAVGNVILNRVSHNEFPDTIYGVIFDREHGVQFTPIANGAIYNNPSNECIYAADRVLRGENVVGASLYFCNPKTSTNKWIINNRILFSQIGKHNFYL